MRLKEFITRSGGVITAIALLGSMMTMAGAAAPDGSYNCSICGKGFIFNTNVTNTQTYQEMYNVNHIEYLNSPDDSVCYWHTNLSLAQYNGEYVCQSCLEAKICRIQSSK